jgi:hypothetical protein
MDDEHLAKNLIPYPLPTKDGGVLRPEELSNATMVFGK